MADTTDEPLAIRARFDQEFDLLANAMKKAAAEETHILVAKEAERLQMSPTKALRPPGDAWMKTEGQFTLWIQWRYYDQSAPFSVQKDMNILSLEMREGANVVRRAEERFED